MLRGDVDRFYRTLRKDHPTPPLGPCRHLDHVRAIARYYAGLSQEERLLLLAWAKKEESGIGTIPLALSGIPFAGLLLGTRIQDPFASLPAWSVFAVWGAAGLLMLIGFYLHQRQKAYTMLHIVLLEQAIKKGEADANPCKAAPPPEFPDRTPALEAEGAEAPPPTVPSMH